MSNLVNDAPGAAVTLMGVTDSQKNRDSQATPEPRDQGPSWILMLLIIFFAILVASGIAWAFTHRFFEPH
ncbi:MAG TPA: hypothetical protein VHZ09_11720 [Acidobacteriaceae bacterium]|nr:hypothetical protein [Acidobacteriaceae bacterium]